MYKEIKKLYLRNTFIGIGLIFVFLIIFVPVSFIIPSNFFTVFMMSAMSFFFLTEGVNIFCLYRKLQSFDIRCHVCGDVFRVNILKIEDEKFIVCPKCKNLIKVDFYYACHSSIPYEK